MSYVSDYLLATSNNESPLSYHKWCCLASLSALAGRRFWFNLGPFRYYPNFYTILVGDPGVKKSAAMDVAKNIVRQVGGIPMAATSTTKEAITKMMGADKFPGKRFFSNMGFQEEYNQLSIFATEFSTFLGVAPNNMVDFLTAIYTENVYDEKYKNTGDSFFAGPYITMLACMTPQTVKAQLKFSLLTGGFSRRTMFVWGGHGKPIAFPGNTPDQQAALYRCISFGQNLQQHSGEFKFTEETNVWWQEWYDRNYSEVRDKPSAVQPYYGTKHEFMIKTAMLLSLSEDPLARTITPTHFEVLNKRFFFPVEEDLPRVFEGAGINPNAQAIIQVCRMLEQMNRPMNRKTIEAMFFDQVTDLRALQDSLDHLINVGRLEQRELRSGGTILGRVIAAPGLIGKRYSDEELVPYLAAARPTLQLDSGTDSSPSNGQVPLPGTLPGETAS